MEYGYNTYKKLNIKKILIIICILILAILAYFGIFKIKDIKDVQDNPYTTFTFNNDTMKFTVSKKFNLEQYSSDYLLELRNKDNLDIFISRLDKIEEKTLEDITIKDQEDYINNFENAYSLSDIEEITINSSIAYTYNFHYTDNDTVYYIQIIWFETEDGYYSIDIEYPIDMEENYSGIITEIETTFIKY